MCTNRRDDSRVATGVISSCEMSETVETEKSLQMAIMIGPGHPIKEFSDEFAQNLQETLVTAMYAVEDGPIPVFDTFELSKKKNYIGVTCFDGYSKRWLIDAVKKLSPFDEKAFLVVEEETVPELRLFYVFVPCSATSNTNDLLTRIKKSTPNLKVDFWKIRETKAVAKGTAVHIEIDTFSIQLIEEMEYAVRLGMGWVYFWDHENNKGHQAAKFSAYLEGKTVESSGLWSGSLKMAIIAPKPSVSSGSLKTAIIAPKPEYSGSFIMAIIAPKPESSHHLANILQNALIPKYDRKANQVAALSGLYGDSSQKYIRVTCGNEYSKRWLIDAVRKLSPALVRTWLRAVEEETVSQLRDFYVHVPKSALRDTSDPLKRIKVSNPYLKTDFWNIRKSKPHMYGTGLRIQIDTFSIQLIEEMDYHVLLRTSCAYFWDEVNKKGHPHAKILHDDFISSCF